MYVCVYACVCVVVVERHTSYIRVRIKGGGQKNVDHVDHVVEASNGKGFGEEILVDHSWTAVDHVDQVVPGCSAAAGCVPWCAYICVAPCIC